jgi:hypothetical protein
MRQLLNAPDCRLTACSILQRNKRPHNKPNGNNSNNSNGHFKHGKQKNQNKSFWFFCAQFAPSLRPVLWLTFAVI